jgi:hypothetical protein
MEAAAAPNRINVSAAIYHRVKDFFAMESRGRILTKENKELEIYLFQQGPARVPRLPPRRAPPPDPVAEVRNRVMSCRIAT